MTKCACKHCKERIMWFDYRGLGPGPREREEARAGAAAEDDGRHRVRPHVPPRRRRRRRLTASACSTLAHQNTKPNQWIRTQRTGDQLTQSQHARTRARANTELASHLPWAPWALRRDAAGGGGRRRPCGGARRRASGTWRAGGAPPPPWWRPTSRSPLADAGRF